MSPAIVLVGLSHRTASLAVRERAALDDGAARAVLRGLRGRVEEALVLSTCNRTELLAVASSAAEGEAALREALPEATYARFELDAVEHLFRVAAGLESAIVGESEIVGQLRAAVARAEEERALGPVLREASRHALVSARRVRARTGVARGATSTASLVARMAGEAAPGGRVLLIGAGRLISAVAGALAGGHELMFANRTPAAARLLGDRYGGMSAALDRLDPLLARAEVVVSATGAPHPVLTAERLAACTRRVTVIDLAVPRDVEPRAAELPHVELFDIDAVQARLDAGRALRWAEAERAGAVVAGEVQRFASWRRERRLEPLLERLWRRAESLRQAEVDRLGAGLPAAERRRLDAATAAFVRRLLDGPSRRLRERGAGSERELELLLTLLEADEPAALRRVA
jgi:glutamyl-tRNA reductase